MQNSQCNRGRKKGHRSVLLQNIVRSFDLKLDPDYQIFLPQALPLTACAPFVLASASVIYSPAFVLP